MEIILIVGFVLCIIGVGKMKYGGSTFKGLAYAIIGLVLIFIGNSIGDANKPESSKVTQKIEREVKDEIRDQVIDSTPQDLGSHWISDANDVYLWNPEPQDGEYINWSVGYVRDGNHKFADGVGVVTWYRNGQVIQVDEGTFIRGRHHGQFKHTFKSGNVDYSNWDHGVEIR